MTATISLLWLAFLDLVIWFLNVPAWRWLFWASFLLFCAWLALQMEKRQSLKRRRRNFWPKTQ